jgi:hypothetical protein
MQLIYQKILFGRPNTRLANGWASRTYEEDEKRIQIFGENTRGEKKSLGKPRSRWQDNNKTNLE